MKKLEILSDDVDIDYCTIKNAISILSMYPDDARLEISVDCHDDLRIDITFLRDETAEEEIKRLGKLDVAMGLVESTERTELSRLLEKYGKE